MSSEKPRKILEKRKTPKLPMDNDLLSEIIWQVCSEGNKKVKTKLNNKADLTSLIPLIFAVLGLIEFVRRPVMPKWYDWGWFSYSVFRDLNTEKRKIPHFHSEKNNEEE